VQKFRVIVIILCDATEDISVVVDAKILVVKRGIGGCIEPGLAGGGRGGNERGNFI
jgi:hypothetical protein